MVHKIDQTIVTDEEAEKKTEENPLQQPLKLKNNNLKRRKTTEEDQIQQDITIVVLHNAKINTQILP